ncbi:MAG: hypothetical protein E6J90_28850 [Deltaproteobacteria bacterium]|nr:MAG: hypothetical protein E6J91_39050 [Deltaproteobacteria bacterium]TMQ13370.1 MAG: hypothetical protein E6J90_28850 [Deltaproteobacteria bacterium]
MGSIAVAVALCASAGPAAAEPAVLLASRWPSVPADRGLSLEDQITEHLTQLGNELCHHLDLLSHDMFQLRVDGFRRRAHVRLGGGNAEMVSVRLDGDIQFEDINARIHTRIDLALHGHAMHLELPTFEMSPAEYRGDRGVELRVPLFEQKF